MNSIEYNRFVDQLILVLEANAGKAAFRYDLNELIRAARCNLPRRHAFPKVSDALTLTSLVERVGVEWLVAEIEGTQVQFVKKLPDALPAQHASAVDLDF